MSSRSARKAGGLACFCIETLESRQLLSSAQDITGLTALRNDSDFSGVDGSGIGVAVIDTGAWAAHPDLRSNFLVYFDAVQNRYTSAGTTNISAAVDPDGHGTHTAGTAVSSNPEIGVATHAELIAIRGIPSDADRQPQFDTVENSLDWVLANYQQYNIKVINMSLGDYTTNFNVLPGGTRPAIFDELEHVGITTVISSGNNYGNFASLGAASPAIYGTLSVANTWPDNGPTASFPIYGGNGDTIHFVAGENDAAPDRLAATSQRSTLANQVAAPGEEILSTWNDPNKLYNRLSGTSMSAPFVSGVVALMQDAAFTYGGRYLTTGEVQSVVRGTADTFVDSDVSTNFRVPVSFDSNGQPFRSGPDQNLPETGQTFYRVNAYRAVQAVRNLVTSGTPVPDPDPVPVTTADANNTTTTSVVVPSLNATQQFQLTGNIGKDGTAQIGNNDVDLYRIDLESPGVVTFATGPVSGGANFDAYLRLFNSSGNQIAFADDTQGLYPTLQSVRLAAGRYYFGVSSFNNSAYTVSGSGATNGQSAGDYNLTVGLSNADPNGVFQGATHVDLANPDTANPNNNLPANFFRGSIGSDPNPLDPSGARVQIGPTDVDMFEMTAPDTGVLFIDTDAVEAGLSDAVDTYVRVFDSNLTQIAFNDDSNQTTDSFLQLNVTAGAKYYVAVTTFGNRSFDPQDPFNRTSTTNLSGSYQLYLYFDNGDGDGTVFTALDADIGTAETGSIGEDDDQPILGANSGNKDVDFFLYTPDSDGLLDVSATGDGGFVPVLTLWRFDPAANNIVRVRSTAGSAAHLIAQVAANDEMYVSVTGVGNNDFKWYAPGSGSGGMVGTYTLNSALRPVAELPTLVNDSIQNGVPEAVNPGDVLTRELGVDGGLIRGDADVDLYRFVAAATGSIAVRATVPGEAGTDPFLRIFNASGQELTYNDDAAANTLDSAVTFSVTAGQTYYIGVNGSSATSRDYNPATGTGAGTAAQGEYVLSLGQIIPSDSGGGGGGDGGGGDGGGGDGGGGNGGGDGSGSGNTPQRTVDFAGKTGATYIDAAGQSITLTIKGPGTGRLIFDDAGNVDPSGLIIDGTTAKSNLTIKGNTRLNNVTINGSLKSFGGKLIDLLGNLTVTGGVAKLQFNTVSGSTITLGSGAPVSFALGNVTDSSISSVAAIKAMKINQWTDTTSDARSDAIAAPAVVNLSARGDFAASLNVGTLGKLAVGSLSGSDIRASGSIAGITAGSLANSRLFAGVRNDLNSLPTQSSDFADLSATIRSIAVKGRALSAVSNTLLAAPIIGKLNLGGITTDNGGTRFGIAAMRIDAVSALTSSGVLSLKRLDSPSQSTTVQDFALELL